MPANGLPPPSFSTPPSPLQERFMLDIFTNDNFFRLSAVAAVALLLSTALLVGPPPSDSRCTLPWC